MAARTRSGTADAPSHQVRERIQAGRLLDRLEQHALGEAEMSATQLRAAEILLKKALPDLQSTALGGHDEEAARIAVVVFKGLND
jgi:hypothetical protein